MKSLFKTIAGFARDKKLLPKAVCLALAVVLWVILSQARSDRVKYTVPIEVRRLASDQIVSSISSRYAQVVLEGSRDELRGVEGKNIRAYVIVSNPTPGTAQRYSVYLNHQNIPENVYISLYTRHIYLTVEKKEHRVLRVVPRLKGNIDDGLVITEIKVDPVHVTAGGPRSALADAAFIYTETIMLESAPGTVEKTVQLDREQFPETELGVKTVKVRITVEERENGVGIEVPLSVKNQDRKYRYVVDTPMVRVYCALPGAKLEAKNVTAFVDSSRFNSRAFSAGGNSGEDFFDAQVSVTFHGVEAELISVVPERVTVRIMKR